MHSQKIAGYAPVNGLNMYYEVHGEGSMPLVLIHGGGSTIESTFNNILPLFLMYTPVIAVELQAHGRTNDRDAPETFEQDADDVAVLLRQLKVDKVNIFGFSNGGTTTMQIAIRHPGLVNKIIFASATYAREGMIEGFFEGMKNATIKDMPKSLQDAFLKLTPDKNRLQLMFEKDKNRMLNFKNMEENDLRSINAKTLVMSSDRDVVTTAHAVKISRLIPGARLIILPGLHGEFIGAAEGSVASISKNRLSLPEITAELVRNFLEE
jgi:pimeloyl-ACP methyl ester carboxylesterase